MADKSLTVASYTEVGPNDDIGLMFAALLAAPRPTPVYTPSGLDKCRTLATDQIKALWDSYDGAVTADPEISGEAVHMVLNERGEGAYCAV